MSDTATMNAAVREGAGKGAARATRKEGRVPAVIYGNKQDPETISLDPVELMHQIRRAGFFARVVELDVAGTKQRVLPRDLQLDPVTDQPLHVDFLRFSEKTKLAVEVEVQFINDQASPGIKRGGVLNVVRHTVELLARPDDIPSHLTVDLTGLEIGDSVHISQIELPEGVVPTITDRDFTVATVAGSTAAIEDAHAEMEEGEEGEEGAEGAEGEDASAEDGDSKEEGGESE